MGSCLLGAPVGVLWICNWVMYTGAVSAVVCLGWGVGICGVNLSLRLALRYPSFLLCNPISVLLSSIPPMSCLGLPHIYLGVMI